VDQDGYVFVMSRTGDIINVAGHRLSTGGIEEVLASHCDVAECAVFGVNTPGTILPNRNCSCLTNARAVNSRNPCRAGTEKTLASDLVLIGTKRDIKFRRSIKTGGHDGALKQWIELYFPGRPNGI
jgi:acyl-coenzyme A synthetase/AMP-(fatty) acid ligase